MDKYIQAIVNTAQSIYDGAVVMCERHGYSDSVMGSEIDKLFGLELLCVWLGNRELDEKISLMREKLRDMKNNKRGGANEGQPVKGDTAKDGGMLKAVRDRVQAEYDELSEKSCKLYVFMGSESFQILSEKHRELLEQQSNVMAEYGQIIQERLNLLDDEYTHGGADEGQPVKGDTARDGGRECCTCGKLYPFMCECGGF